MIYFISGPMSNYPDFNRPAFFECENYIGGFLRFDVVNPARNFDGDTTREWGEYIAVSCQQAAAADYLLLLPGWERSKGVKRELESHTNSHVYEYNAKERNGYRIGDPFPRTDAIARCEAAQERQRAFSSPIDGGGYKASMDDPSKPPLALIPKALLLGAGRALGFGATKYAPHNYRRGMKWSEPYSALLRHLSAWNEGEDADPETGFSHLDHAAAMLAFLMEFSTKPEYATFDDRWKGTVSA